MILTLYNPITRLRWTRSGGKEFGRLCQGYGEEQGIDAIEWIPRTDLPLDKTATYPCYTVAYRPEKEDPYRSRITAGGDRLEYFGNVTTHTAGMEVFKIIVSTPHTRCCTSDISNMYLCSDLPHPEFVRFKISIIPDINIQLTRPPFVCICKNQEGMVRTQAIRQNSS